MRGISHQQPKEHPALRACAVTAAAVAVLSLLGVVTMAGAPSTGMSSAYAQGQSVTMRGVFRLIHADRRVGESMLYALEGDDGRLHELRGSGRWHGTAS